VGARVAAVLLFACAVAIGCDRRGPAPDARPAASAAEALQPRFEPPQDRLLTDRHLELYVRVRRAAKDRSDADAARALGVDPDEFAWVRARVVEALVALDERRVRDASGETYARAIAALSETRRSVRDPETARTIDSQIAGLEKEASGLRRPDAPPAEIAANARKVAGRRAEIEVVSR